MDDFQPAEVFKIKDLDTLKTLADPLRNQIFESLTLQPLTVKQVAEKLGLAPSKLYYHVNLLERRGLIRVVEKRVVSNIIEKVYRAAAYCLEVEHSLLSFATPEGQENVYTALTATIDMTREDLLRSLEARSFELSQGADAHPRRLLITRLLNHLDETQVQAFQERFQALLEDFGAAETTGASSEEGVHTYALTIAFYPLFYYSDTEGDQSKTEQSARD